MCLSSEGHIQSRKRINKYVDKGADKLRMQDDPWTVLVSEMKDKTWEKNLNEEKRQEIEARLYLGSGALWVSSKAVVVNHGTHATTSCLLSLTALKCFITGLKYIESLKHWNKILLLKNTCEECDRIFLYHIWPPTRCLFEGLAALRNKAISNMTQICCLLSPTADPT